MICAAVQAKDAAEFLYHLNVVKDKVSLAEVRLDCFRDPYSVDLEELVAASAVPLIFTNRHHSEGGNIHQEEEKRLGLLKKAVDAGAAYIDIEFSSDKFLRNELLEYANKKACKVIFSWHDFQKTPADKDLVNIVNDMGKSGVDIVKVVTTPLEQGDIKKVLSLYYLGLEQQGCKLVAFCMGDIGKISRVACLALGAPFSFATCIEGGATAPGQLTVDKLFDMLRTLNLLRTNKKA